MDLNGPCDFLSNQRLIDQKEKEGDGIKSTHGI